MIPGTDSLLRIFVSRQVSRTVTALLAAIILLAPFIVSQQRAVAQEFPTEISGRVVQGTLGADLPIGLKVVLLVVDDQLQEIISSQNTVVGSNGEFSFTNFASGPGLSYRVAADNGDHTPSVDLKLGEDAFKDVEVTIYDSTASFEDIRLVEFEMLVTGIDRRLRLMGVLGQISLVNSGDTIWIPDLTNPQLTGLDLLRFNMPEGFTDLSVETNLPAGDILVIPTGFALTNPVPPGEFSILMTFMVEYSGDSMLFPLRLPYGADEVRIIYPDSTGVVTGLGLGEPQGAIIIETAYSIVDGQAYPRDSQLDVIFSSLPTPSLVERTHNFFDGRGYIVVIAWIVGATMLGLLVYAFFFARQHRFVTRPDGENSYPEYTGMQRTAIVETIANLDQRHEADEIDDANYSARRSALTQAALAARVSETQPT
jgi:hypothetical protein